MSEFVDLDPSQLEPSELYDLLHMAVQPRPIALISTTQEDGSPNLAPFSYFTMGGIQPPSVVFCPIRSQGANKKNSLRNVERTAEFVVNVVDDGLADALLVLGQERKTPYNEFAAAGLTPLASQLVKPPRIAESPLQLECRLFQVVHHGEEQGSASYVIGEVVRIHVGEAFREGSKQLRLVGRLSGPDYIDSNSRQIFQLPRPNR